MQPEHHPTEVGVRRRRISRHTISSDAFLGLLADRQLQAMTEGMKKGESPFAPPREFQQAGQKIFWTLGQGQAHFYYRQGSKVIWVAANESVAFPALKAALRSIQ